MILIYEARMPRHQQLMRGSEVKKTLEDQLIKYVVLYPGVTFISTSTQWLTLDPLLR